MKRAFFSITPQQIALGMLAGLVAGLIATVLNISYATLLFSGERNVYFPRGVGLFLLGGCVSPLVLVCLSSLPGATNGPQATAAALLAPAVGVLFSQLGTSGGGDAFFPTVLALIVISTFLTGLTFFLVGQFKLGNFVRYIPYPVVGGFLAGTGWLLAYGSLQVMLGQDPSTLEIGELFKTPLLLRWAPAVALAITTLLALNKTNRILVWPSLLLGATLLFYGILFASGLSFDEARAMGLLMPVYPSGALWSPLALDEFSRVDWHALAGQMGQAVAIPAVNLLAFLLNVAALEVMIKRDLDINYELRVEGCGNALISLGGSPSGFLSLSGTVLIRQMGAGRVGSLCSALVSLLVLWLGVTVTSYLPVALLGSLLLVIGISFLIDWLYRAWFKLPLSEYLIVWVSLVGIGAMGFVPGIILGMLFAVLVFAFKYSQVNTVRDILNGKIYHAHVDRADLQREVLRQFGGNIHIFRLQGYIFFGTSEKLLHRARELLTDSPVGEHFILLDFRHVSGLDSSVIYSLMRLRQMAELHRIQLVLAQVSPAVSRLMERGDFQADSRVHFFLSLDHAMEWCEDRLLVSHAATVRALPEGIKGQLAQTFPRPELIDLLIGYLEKMELEANASLMHYGERTESMYFVESGRLQVFLETLQGRQTRLRSICGGTVVGEMGLYLKGERTANVVATEKSVLYRLSAQSMYRMEEEEPAVASALHKWIARLLAERMVDSNRSIEALLD